MEIGRLQGYRHRLALSQRELARRAGVTAVTVIAAEAGKPVRISTVRKLADALGVEPAVLMGDGDESDGRTRHVSRSREISGVDDEPPPV